MPELVYRIVHGPAATLKSSLHGFMLGNPVFSCQSWKDTANDIQMDLFYWHGLVPFSAYRNWKATCASTPNTPACNNLLTTYTNAIGTFDPDNLYTNFFTGNSSLGVGPTPAVSIQQSFTDYLNRADVQAAVHAQPANWYGDWDVVRAAV